MFLKSDQGRFLQHPAREPANAAEPWGTATPCDAAKRSLQPIRPQTRSTVTAG